MSDHQITALFATNQESERKGMRFDSSRERKLQKDKLKVHLWVIFAGSDIYHGWGQNIH
jgi:hypothetical protein